MNQTNQEPGLPNPEYNLISVLHHATKEAFNCDQYIRDADEGGDDALAQFFREVREEDRRRAMRAKELMHTRI